MTDAYRAYQMPGMAMFAGILSAMLGTFNALYGILLLFNSEWLVITDEGLLYLDLTAWGWLLLVFGVVQIFAAIGIMTARTWARLFGISWAALVAIGHIYSLSVYPIFSIITIALAVLIIYALSAGLTEEA